MAILEQSQPERAIKLSPEHLALTYVANSTILNFFGSIGVNLDPFFKLLWRHVLTVEILTHHFKHSSEPSKSLLERLRALFMGPSKHDKDMRQAIQYLAEWGKTFWQDTEFRVKEITSRVETELDAELKATLGSKAAAVSGSVQSADRFTEEEKSELVSRGQHIISQVQAQDLHKVLRLLDSGLTDKQHGYSGISVLPALDGPFIHPKGAERTKLCSSLNRPAPEAVTSARADGRPTGAPWFQALLRHRSTVGPFLLGISSVSGRRLSSGHRQCPDPPEHVAEQPPGQMPFRQQEPVVPGVLH